MTKFLVKTSKFLPLMFFLVSACQTAQTQGFENTDFRQNEIPRITANREEWYSLIKWSDTCEQIWQQEKESFEGTGNGIRLFQVDEQEYIVFVICSTGPNFSSEQLYQIDFLSEPTIVQQLGLKIVYLDGNEKLIEYVGYETTGVLQFDEDTQTLAYLYKGGGTLACSHYYIYAYENRGFTLLEARQKQCEDDPSLMPEEWGKIY